MPIFAKKTPSTSRRALTQRSPRGIRKGLSNAWGAVTRTARRVRNGFASIGTRISNFVNPAGHLARVREGDRERRSARSAASAARNARISGGLGRGRSLSQIAMEAHGSALANRAAQAGRSISKTARSAATAFRSLFK